MAKPDELEGAEVAVTMEGDLASALQIASFQRRSSGDDNCEVSGLVQEAVSEWLHKEIYGPTLVTEGPDQISQDPETPDPEAAKPSEAATQASRRWLAPLIALGIVLLGVVGWNLVRNTERPTGSPTVAVATGFLTIDAQPWAEVERVVDESGLEVTLPHDRYTPLRLELPPGSYRVNLIRPESPLAQTCAVQVTALETIRCMPQQDELDVNGLFRETGWWK